MEFTSEELDQIQSAIEDKRQWNTDWRGKVWDEELNPILDSILQKIKEAR